MKARVVFAAALASICCSCARESPDEYRRTWKRIELPGFSLEMPAGEVVMTSTETWAGKHQVKIEGSLFEHWLDDIVINGNAAVSWSSDVSTVETWNRDFLPIVESGMAEVVPGSRILATGRVDEKRWYAVVGTDRAPIAFGVVRCDETFQVEVMYARYHDVKRQMAHVLAMMASVRCHAQAQARISPIASKRLPANFGLVETEGAYQLLRSLDGETLGINFTQGDVQGDEKILMAMLRSLIAQSVGVEASTLTLTKVEIPDGIGPGPTVLRVVNAANETSFVGALYCDRVKQSVLSFWSAPQVSDAQAVERIGEVGCPEEPSKPIEDFAIVAQRACAAGNATACSLE